MLQTSYRHPTEILQTSYINHTQILHTYCRNNAEILSQSYRNVAEILQTTSSKLAEILRTYCRQVTQFLLKIFLNSYIHIADTRQQSYRHPTRIISKNHRRIHINLVEILPYLSHAERLHKYRRTRTEILQKSS